ncbi:MAG TPA: hypothetical protein VMU02_06345, partial [bacterium]|nr:hypothetical protein [bacterium]
MRKLAVIAILLLGLAQVCRGGDAVIARGGDFVLAPVDLQMEVFKLGPSYTFNDTFDDRKKLVDVVSTRFFLAEEAVKRGLGVDELPEEEASARITALSDAYHRWKIEKAVRVPRVASKPVLDNLDRRLHFREMVFAVYPVAEEVLGDIRAGASFDDMVKRVEGREDITVHDRGWELWKNFDRSTAYQVFQLHVGEVSGIIPSKAGYSIFYLVEDKRWGESAELIYLRSKRFVRGIKEAELTEQEREELSRIYKVTYSDRGLTAALRVFALAFGGSRPPDSLLAEPVVTYTGGGLSVAY